MTTDTAAIYRVKDAKRVFIKKGACSHTFFHILNREFGHISERHERAADPLAGGILQQGFQCGMLWGAAMASGAEAYRRYENLDQAMASAMTTTKLLMDSYEKRTNAIDCIDVTECDWTNKIAMMKFMLSGKFLSCFKLADKWAPEAIATAYDGLSTNSKEIPTQPLSCASEVARKLGASEEEMAMVAGFAGGMGLSGRACGALGAAIWLKTLKWTETSNKMNIMQNPYAQKTMDVFYQVTDYKILCAEVSGRSFESMQEHAEFLKNGGCEELIDRLVES